MEISAQYRPATTNFPFDVNNYFHLFLSFHVRNTFVDHLYESLSAAGLRVFLNCEELEKGKDIDSSLQTAIETSDILIPIFSKRYAESTWCLEEAARMCRSNGLIIPLFYDVKPRDVRYPQREGGAFAEAFQKHYKRSDRQDENTIEGWRSALHQISSRSGWTVEAEFGSAGLGSLVQKKFNVYLGFCEEEVGETLMGHLCKSLRICRADYQSLWTGSLRTCRGKEADQSIDINRAIDSSDILVPVVSKGFVNSDRCLRQAAAMCRSNGLIIPCFHYMEPLNVQHPEAEGSPYAWAFKELYSNISDGKFALGSSHWE